MTSRAYVFSPQQVLGLAELVLAYPHLKPLRLTAFCPNSPRSHDGPCGVFQRTLSELDPILTPLSSSLIQTYSGLRSAQIALEFRKTMLRDGEVDVLMTGLPTYGFIERHPGIRNGLPLYLLDDGIDSADPFRHFPNLEPEQKGGRAYGQLIRKAIGSAPSSFNGPIRMFTTFPAYGENKPAEIRDFEIERHEFGRIKSWYRQRPLAQDQNSMPTANIVLIGTDLSALSDRLTRELISGLASDFGITHYAPHRHEPWSRTRELESSLGITVIWPQLPMELQAIKSSPSNTFVVMPGALWYTLPRVLSEDDCSRLVLVSLSSRILRASAASRKDKYIGQSFRVIEQAFPDRELVVN